MQQPGHTPGCSPGRCWALGESLELSIVQAGLGLLTISMKQKDFYTEFATQNQVTDPSRSSGDSLIK